MSLWQLVHCQCGAAILARKQGAICSKCAALENKRLRNLATALNLQAAELRTLHDSGFCPEPCIFPFHGERLRA